MIKSILKKLSFEERATLVYFTAIISFIALFATFLFGICVGSEGQISQAIKAGVAEYHLDKTTGDVKFHYINR